VTGIASDREFLAVAAKRLGHLFPALPQQPGLHKPRRRLTDTIEWLIGVFAADSSGWVDGVVLLDSTPVEFRRSVETARRSELADACGYGYGRSPRTRKPNPVRRSGGTPPQSQRECC
jgi:hypothetical protein